MDHKTMIEMDYVRALCIRWGEATPTPPPEYHAVPLVRAADRWRRLDQQLRAAASQVPSRQHTFDWFGRRLISWGWQLRMRYGLRGR